jgi:hypothetical protein
MGLVSLWVALMDQPGMEVGGTRLHTGEGVRCRDKVSKKVFNDILKVR